MIFDQQNMFFDAKALSASTLTSDVVKCPAEASDPLTLVLQKVGATAPSDGTLSSIVLQTANDAAFTTPVVLGTYTQQNLRTKLPRGGLGYLRLVVTSTHTNGTITAGLVMDDNVE